MTSPARDVDEVRRRIRARLPGLLARREFRAAWLYGRWTVMWLANPAPWAVEDCAEHAVECAVRAAHHGRRALAVRPARISVPRSLAVRPARISVPRSLAVHPARISVPRSCPCESEPS